MFKVGDLAKTRHDLWDHRALLLDAQGSVKHGIWHEQHVLNNALVEVLDAASISIFVYYVCLDGYSKHFFKNILPLDAQVFKTGT